MVIDKKQMLKITTRKHAFVMDDGTPIGMVAAAAHSHVPTNDAKISLREKLLNRKHVTESGCWEWNGARIPNGYGIVRFFYKKMMVHRLMWEIEFGPAEDGMVVARTCGNILCFNPRHLYLEKKEHALNAKMEKMLQKSNKNLTTRKDRAKCLRNKIRRGKRS